MTEFKPLGSGMGIGQGQQSTLQAQLAICTVEDSLAGTGTYRIRLPAGPLVSAGDCTHSTAIPLGARPIIQYPPKSRVLAVYFPDLDQALIIGACPKGMSDPRLVLPDSIVLRSCVGINQDPMHYSSFVNPDTSMPNQSGGRAADTLPGDWGMISDLGLAVFIGRMMAALRASDGAKIEMFWGDDLTRITGYNMEIHTAGSEETKKNDEGEFNEVLRISPYPWEALGMRAISDATTNADGKLAPNSENAKFEPIAQDQLIIARYLRFRGYLGDLMRTFTVLPKIGGSGPETYSAQTVNPGLSEEVQAIDGSLIKRSAKQILFEKYIVIPTPKEMISPEDPTGDNLTNYKPSDQLGEGEAYELPEFVWGSEIDANIRGAQLFDYQAWLFSRYTNGGLVAHKKDWYYPDESDIPAPLNSTVYTGDLQIGHKFLCDLPEYGELIIDNRPGHSVRYYKSRSAFHMTDDGSVLIEDAYGSQVQMKGGSIFFSCVGDIWCQPGRSFLAYAPYDAVLRAGNSADISAAKHDVRLKAERNIQILGGNSKTVGGVLIESRAMGPETAADFDQIGQEVQGHGITFKAIDSSINAFGKQIYIGRGQKSSGQVVIDGGDSGRVYMRGQQWLAKFSSLITFTQSTENNPDTKVFALNGNAAVLSVPLQLGGSLVMAPTGNATQANLIVGGSAVIHEALAVGRGVVTNGGFAAVRGSPFVGEQKNPVDLGDSPEELGARIETQVVGISEIIEKEEEIVVDDENTSPGNDDFQRRVGVSMRDTVKDLKLQETNFILFESRWQQMLAAKGGGTTWDEPIVEAPTGQPTRPHPGFVGWTEWQAYAKIQLKNFSIQQGRAIARDSMTEEGATPTRQSLEAGYLINVQE